MSRRSRSKTRTSTKLSRPVSWALALLLLPLVWGVIRQTALMGPHLLREGFRGWGVYAAGVLTYFVSERLITKPMWLYVFGHELTHALTGVLSGAKIHSFKAKSSGGEVHLSKSNAFIALSPYIIPLYALVLISAYAITRHWWNPPQLMPVFQFLLGLALAFHISLTISAVHRHQPDLKILGLFLSAVLIVLCNVMILAALGISLFSKTPTFSSFARAAGHDTMVAWSHCIDLSFKGGKLIADFVRSQSWTR